jgi:hypothetical protein
MCLLESSLKRLCNCSPLTVDCSFKIYRAMVKVVIVSYEVLLSDLWLREGILDNLTVFMFVFFVLIESLSCFLHNVVVETVFIWASSNESIRLSSSTRCLHCPVFILFSVDHSYVGTLLLIATMWWQVCDLLEGPAVVVRAWLNSSKWFYVIHYL